MVIITQEGLDFDLLHRASLVFVVQLFGSSLFTEVSEVPEVSLSFHERLTAAWVSLSVREKRIPHTPLYRFPAENYRFTERQRGDYYARRP